MVKVSSAVAQRAKSVSEAWYLHIHMREGRAARTPCTAGKWAAWAEALFSLRPQHVASPSCHQLVMPGAYLVHNALLERRHRMFQ